MKSVRTNLFAALLVLLGASSAFADPVVVGLQTTIDFEDQIDLSSLTDAYASFGVTFDNAFTLTAGSVGGSLNDFDYPPLSGANVLFNNGGTMRLLFDTALTNISGFFTYNSAITMTALNFGTVVGNVSSLADANFLSSGNPTPNEFLSFAGLFNEILIQTADPLGEFVVDDLAFTVVDTSNVPEPGTLSLALLGLAGACASKSRRLRARIGRRSS